MKALLRLPEAVNRCPLLCGVFVRQNRRIPPGALLMCVCDRCREALRREMADGR